MNRIFAALLLWILPGESGRAQTNCTHTLSVFLTEAHTRAGVFPAEVTIAETDAHFHPDENGFLRIEKLCAGTYTFILEAPDHLSRAEVVTIPDMAELHVRLEHGKTLAGVEVTGSARTAIPIQSATTLDAKALAGRPLGEILGSVNGVSTLSNGATLVKPVIHGLYGARVLTLNNGIRQEDQQWGTDHALAIDPLALENVRVVRGGAGVRYGTEAIGGAVVLEPAPIGREAGTAAVLHTAFFSNNRMGLVSGRLEHRFRKLPRLALRIQGSGKTGGNYQLPGGYWAANTGVREGNGSLLAQWRGAHSAFEVYYSLFHTKLGLYRGSHTGNEKDLAAAVASSVPLVPADFTYSIDRPFQQVTHHLAKAQAAIDTRLGRASVNYGFQHNMRREFDVTRLPTERAQLNLSLLTNTLGLNLDHRRLGAFSGSIGVDGLYAENRFEDGDRVFLPFYDLRGIGAYAIERFRKRDWTVEGGLRWDSRHYEVLNPEGSAQQITRYERLYNGFSGTLGLRHPLGNAGHWNATLAATWRAPQPAELFAAGYHQSAARIEQGTNALKAERAYGVNVDAEYSWKKLKIEATLYHQRIKDYVFLKPGPGLLTIRGFFRTFQYQQTDAALTGADLTLTCDWSEHFTTTAQASLLRARDVERNEWLILIPPDRYRGSARYTHDWGSLKEAFIAVNGQFVQSQTRIPENFDQIDFPRPPAAYFLLGAEVGSALRFGKQPIQWSLAVNNALNTRYREYLDAFRYFIDRPGIDVALRLMVPISFGKQTN